jgi:hypothetical protein
MDPESLLPLSEKIALGSRVNLIFSPHLFRNYVLSRLSYIGQVLLSLSHKEQSDKILHNSPVR